MSMIITKHDVRRILADSNSANVLCYDAFVQMNLSLCHLNPVSVPLVNFTGDSVGAKEKITLSITARTPPDRPSCS